MAGGTVVLRGVPGDLSGLEGRAYRVSLAGKGALELTPVREALPADRAELLGRALRPFALLWYRHGEALPSDLRQPCRRAAELLGVEGP